MKKIILILVALMCLAGCTKNNPEPTPTDPGLSQQEVMKELSYYESYHSEGSDTPYFIIFYDQKKIGFGIEASDYFVSGVIKSFTYKGNNTYEFIVDVPAFEGNELSDPREAYEADFTVTINSEDYSKINVVSKKHELKYDFVGLVETSLFEYPLELQDEQCYFGMHVVASLEGAKAASEEGYYNYSLKLYFDNQQVDASIFAGSPEAHIHSSNMAANLQMGRYGQYFIIYSNVAKLNNGWYLAVWDMVSGNVVATLDDVDITQIGYGSTGFTFIYEQYDNSGNTLASGTLMVNSEGVTKK